MHDTFLSSGELIMLSLVFSSKIWSAACTYDRYLSVYRTKIWKAMCTWVLVRRYLFSYPKCEARYVPATSNRWSNENIRRNIYLRIVTWWQQLQVCQAGRRYLFSLYILELPSTLLSFNFHYQMTRKPSILLKAGLLNYMTLDFFPIFHSCNFSPALILPSDTDFFHLF